MRDDISIIIYVLLEIFSGYTVYRLMRIFHEDAFWGKKIEIVSYIVYYIISFLLSYFIIIPIVLFISNLVLMFLVTINYDSDLKKKILSVLFINMILVCVDIIVVAIIQYQHLLSLIKGGEAEVALFSYVSAKILVFIIMLIMSRCNGVKRKVTFPNIYWICLILIPTVTIVWAMNISMDNLSYKQAVISVTVILFINFAVFYLYDLLSLQAEEKATRLLLQQENNNILKQMDIYKYNLKNVDRAKHDLNNHIMILKSYIESEQKQEALKYLDSELKTLFSDKKNINTGVTIVDSILNLKTQEAESNGIDMFVRAAIPYELVLDSFDMIIILHGLLDYAVQETKKLERQEKKITVNIKFKFVRGRLIIQVWLPFEEGITHPADTGEIERTVNKYDGFIKTNEEENGLKLTALLYLNMDHYL